MRWAVALVCAVGLALGPTGGAAEPQVEFLGSYHWPQSEEWFGGFSGIELEANGTSGWVVSDNGFSSGIELVRADGQGIVTAVEGYQFRWLWRPDFVVVTGLENDAEGLALDGAGHLLVSFELLHRIWRYGVTVPAEWQGQGAELIPPHPDFAELQRNSSLEALAVAPDGAIITVPERSGKLSRPFPAYRLKDGVWDELKIPRRPPYLVSGADFGPDGRFYLLERHLNGIFGFQSRVRRFDYDSEAGFSNEVTLFESASALHDNLEGIAVWRDAAGRIRLTMVSDNNFNSFQRTELVDYAVTE